MGVRFQDVIRVFASRMQGSNHLKDDAMSKADQTGLADIPCTPKKYLTTNCVKCARANNNVRIKQRVYSTCENLPLMLR